MRLAGKGSTVQSSSPSYPKGRWEVEITRKALPTGVILLMISPAPLSIRCSKLSSTTSVAGRSRIAVSDNSESPSSASNPSASRIRSTIACRFEQPARGTNTGRISASGALRRTSWASRVFPIPGAPTNVIRRGSAAPSMDAVIASNSISRPTNKLFGRTNGFGRASGSPRSVAHSGGKWSQVSRCRRISAVRPSSCRLFSSRRWSLRDIGSTSKIR